ncbi:MAG: DUF499 domain-containing protein [Planctomycetota bacterium]
MSTPWKPWHEVVELRDDLRSGELTLAMFAADLHDVAMGEGRPVYQDPEEFFSLTYPTFNLRELAKDVILRLAGENDRAVRQLQLTYGGGKTHSLIALYHLVNNPDALPDSSAVSQFREHIGIELPEARISTLTFDKLDEKKGMAARSPGGDKRNWLYPWTVLAWQLAGPRGLKILGMEGGAERETQPAENVLRELLEVPLEDGLSPLILIDEVLMWARTMVGVDGVWGQRLQDFFQCLTQAATKVDRCAIVASLLATRPEKSDELGREITGELFDVFQRQEEQPVEPVEKQDVAEILRRRFFTEKSLKDSGRFDRHATAALKGAADLDKNTEKNRKTEEKNFRESYPFHPDLIDVFYTKWTNLKHFQRTRGVLRNFAIAMRDAEKWDDSPVVGPNVFLSDPEGDGMSDAAEQLCTVATKEAEKGQQRQWRAIVQQELEKARETQKDYGSLHHREVEQAVFSIFVHSQPTGKKAKTNELMRLVGPTRPDEIDLKKGLQEWAQTSWFLDESVLSEMEAGPDEPTQLPREWRLGPEPNLRQMHDEARQNVAEDLVEARLLEEIGKVKSLTEGASAAGAHVHKLPSEPRDIADDGEFHYAVLGPKAVSEPGEPSEEARRFIDETTTPDRPRAYRNAVLLAVSSRNGLQAARNAIQDYLAWASVQEELDEEQMGPAREERLSRKRRQTRKRISGSIQQAYCIAVTVSKDNEIEAFRVTVDDKPLFTAIKKDRRSRIQDSPVNAEALMPGGPYDLWDEGDTSRRFQDLIGVFAQLPRLPKMLNTDEILETLVQGAAEGLFVLRHRRPDESVRTFWMQEPDQSARKDPGLEVVLPEAAELSEIPPRLLKPGVLPELWEDEEISVRDVCTYFSGETTVKVDRGGYEEPLNIPAASRQVVLEAIREAVKEGELWVICDDASFCDESVPEGTLTDEATLQSSPSPIAQSDLMPESIPGAWEDGVATARDITSAVSEKTEKPLPWGTVMKALRNAVRARELELTDDSASLPCEFEEAGSIKVKKATEGGGGTPPPPARGTKTARAELRPFQIQDLADVVGELKELTVGHGLNVEVQIDVEDADDLSEEKLEKLNKILGSISENLKLG